jgi:putative Holliday junction resolvase
MKYLGIDYGTKRIGLSVSDENGRLAFPYSVIPHNAGLVTVIGSIILKEKIGEVVIGKSTSEDGSDNPVQEKIDAFARELERKSKIPVYFEKEFFTSAEAHGRRGKESLHARQTGITTPLHLDARAAALILQRYLDKENKKNTQA